MKKLFIPVIFLLAVIITISLIINNKDNKQEANSISMKEAYRIAREAVISDNPNALLYSMTSADSMYFPEDSTAGKKGLRKYWNLVFTAPDTTDHWIVLISNKGIKDKIKITAPPMNKEYLIDNMDSLISSKEALKIAQKNYKLKPGEGWAIGYHFVLEKVGGITIIQVVGRDKSNNFAKIAINAETKEIIAAIHKVSQDGVHYNWEIFNKP